jgi:multidrug efflux pump subunit AcrA (membrane-fusion protein)
MAFRPFRAVAMTLLPLALLGGAFAGFGWLRDTRPTVPVAAPVPQVRAVEALRVSPGEVRPMLDLYGHLIAGQTVDLRALVAGEVVTVAPGLVDGGSVRAGETLLAVDPFDHEAARQRAAAELAEARARVAEQTVRIQLERDALTRLEEQAAVVTRERERVAALAAKDIATERALDDVTVRLSQARSAVELRRHQIALAEAQRATLEAALPRLDVAVRTAERNVANTRLAAPFDAVVSNAAAERGRLLNVSDRIATLTAVNRQEVRFGLSDAQYGTLLAEGTPLEGRRVDVVWSGGETVFTRQARIERLAAAASTQAGGFEAVARLELAADDPVARVMRPGAFVSVRLPDRLHRDVVRVPQVALYDNATIFLVNEGRLRRVPVTVAGWYGEDVLVRGAIASGSLVLVSRLGNAVDGMRVEPREIEAPGNGARGGEAR